jgi:hypothetical protein
MDREKVIKALECCTKKVCIYKDTEKECPYSELCDEYDDSFEDCTTALSKDALALLKAQEPRDAVVVQNGIDGSGGWWFQCPNCMMEIEPRDRYCKSCGQAVKWDG